MGESTHVRSSTINRLFSLPGRGLQTFEAMQKLDHLLGHPHHAFRSIHIGGSNGKGSVATKIAASLQAQGYKTGLYTSPHLFSFTERIQINGKPIEEKRAEAILETLFPLSQGLSFFDLLTATSFIYFAQEKIDYGVIEVGLGGRLDATNLIHPILAVITSISLEHTALLGSTPEAIAKEKGAIAKPGVSLIVGPKAAPYFPNAIHAPPSAVPFYDLENQSIARTALDHLHIPATHLEARPPCRFQKVGDILFDVAHNPDAFRRLAEALTYHHPGEKFPFYLAFSEDKDWKQCLDIIQPYASQITFVKTNIPRLVDPEILAKYVPNSQVGCPEIRRGVVTGSFYLIAEVMGSSSNRLMV
ncbi:MAG TPA: Mur ligase family protein [Chlamydiales bacterium]|nr:Mur ligase family protein [Chlamydiales bacterium]